ncbi:hypothetical protein [Subtercola boreus]|uniref:HIRAN domain-containing protein n=1 Tax=Subtercola boreus TaxID=120213 RepID=A0A3E0W661_9MICO|nr:hypothetical protein [Subtercola boreus]RFA18013.1 hypothetical protein B7R24_15265 [Subtercola boreus]RFA18395.1 hypothetical protein B7R23_15300 [Subtercola boreus]RFA24924.1 hypothetical protein B7R25_15295 [Subtercola boreus]
MTGVDATGVPVFAKKDSGSGKLNDFSYDMRPKNGRVTVQLAGSDPHQEAIGDVLAKGPGELVVFIGRRTAEEERTDAPVAVRFFVDSRMTPIVGYMPRGLEAVALDTLSRLEELGRSTRIPAEIVKTRSGLRVNLLFGLTR